MTEGWEGSGGGAGMEEEEQEVSWAQVRIDMGADRQV